MGAKPYPAYKDSGVEWIGDIPEHWEVRKVGNVSRLLSAAESDGDYTVALENIEPWTGNYVFTDSEYAASGIPFETGDVLFGKLRPYLAKVYLAKSSGLAIGDLFTLRTTTSQAPEFFALLLRCKSFIDIVDGLTYGAKMPRVSFSQFKVLPIPTPPLEEQQLIASFLDRETGMIDTLVEQQQQLISLLKEKRQSLISHTVTKGLNPIVRMKDSGVDWIGDIPEHWEVKRLKSLVEVHKRISGDLDRDVLSVTQRGLKVKDLTSNEGQHAMDYSKYQLVSVGDFVLNHMDLVTGYVGLANISGVTSPDYRVVRPLRDSGVENEFLLHIFQDCYHQRRWFKYGQGAAHLGRWRLPRQQFLDFSIPVPPKFEQSQIYQHINERLAHIAHTIDKANQSIALLKERRSSLISAAVTGKIDVREAA
jgi:type I restriction enzyme S subunit